ncbi:hypothetical protein KR222_006717, partial [Zaprionus bogoriensis]
FKSSDFNFIRPFSTMVGYKKSLSKIDSYHAKFGELEKRFDDPTEVAQMDLVKDLDEEFFTTSNELIHALASINNFVASKMKRFVDLLARLHNRHLESLQENLVISRKVGSAEKKLKLAIEATCTSNDMLEKMKEALAEAWRTNDVAEGREAALQAKLQEVVVNVEPTQRSHVRENGNERQSPHEMRIRSLVYRERDRLARELRDYQQRLETNRFYSESLEKIVETNRQMISNQQSRIKSLEKEIFTLEHKIRIDGEFAEEKMNAMRRELQNAMQVNTDLLVFEKKFADATNKLDELKSVIDRAMYNNFTLHKAKSRLEEDNQRLKLEFKNLDGAYKTMRRARDDLQVENRLHIRDMKKKAEIHSVLNRRFHQLSKKNVELMEQDAVMNNELTGVTKKLTVTVVKLEEVSRLRDDCERGRDRLRSEVASLHDAVASLRHDMIVQRGHLQDVQRDLDVAYKLSSEKDVKLQKLEKQKADLINEANELSKTIETLDESAAEKSETITTLREDLQKKTQDYLNTKKQMEIVHSEKIALLKSFTVCGRDRQNLQNINIKLTVQINQLCTQVAMHEKEAIVLSNQIDQLNHLVKQKQSEIHTKEQQIKRVKTELQEMRIRNVQLQHTIEEDEKRFKLMAGHLDEVTKEKSLVGQQMARRNGELRLQHEKLSMMQMALNRGTIQYNQRIEDIRLLKTEIHNLLMSNECLNRAAAGTANMRHEVVRLERQLVRERLNISVFTEEMKHPYRIHRWRVLRGKDPSQYELIRKNQTLLKRNLKLSVERVNMENKLKDALSRYETLKQQLRHMPDPSVKDKLWLQRRINRRQSDKLRAMQAELAINDIDLQSRDVIIQQFQQAIK